MLQNMEQINVTIRQTQKLLINRWLPAQQLLTIMLKQ